MSNYPPGTTDDDPHFTDETPSAEDVESEDGYHCPWCDGDHQPIDHIRTCSGWKPSGMPPTETGHIYGCGCSDCQEEYRRLK